MTIARWQPPVAATRQEQFLLKRLDRVRKLLSFLRLHRHELFVDAFQEELASMYRTTCYGGSSLRISGARGGGRGGSGRHRDIAEELWD